MKSRYNPYTLYLPTSTTLARNVPGKVKCGNLINSGSSELFLKPDSHIPHHLVTLCAAEKSGVPLLWVTSICTIGCCYALVNPAPLPFCHSRSCLHYTNTMLRVMQIAISDTTSKSRIFMEKLQSRAEKHVRLTGSLNLFQMGRVGAYFCIIRSLFKGNWIGEWKRWAVFIKAHAGCCTHAFLKLV